MAIIRQFSVIFDLFILLFSYLLLFFFSFDIVNYINKQKGDRPSYRITRPDTMTVRDIIRILDAELLYGNDELLDQEVDHACGSDMMSDVLAFVKDQAVLLTGLINTQAVRTAEMMDMKCVILVRGKDPQESVLELAKDRDICVLKTEHTMFSACGLLYQNGIRGGVKNDV